MDDKERDELLSDIRWLTARGVGQDGEIVRHHRDFQRIRDELDAYDAEQSPSRAVRAIKAIRNIVG